MLVRGVHDAAETRGVGRPDFDVACAERDSVIENGLKARRIAGRARRAARFEIAARWIAARAVEPAKCVGRKTRDRALPPGADGDGRIDGCGQAVPLNRPALMMAFLAPGSSWLNQSFSELKRGLRACSYES